MSAHYSTTIGGRRYFYSHGRLAVYEADAETLVLAEDATLASRAAFLMRCRELAAYRARNA